MHFGAYIVYMKFILSFYLDIYSIFIWQRGWKLINKSNNKNTGISQKKWIKTLNNNIERLEKCVYVEDNIT